MNETKVRFFEIPYVLALIFGTFSVFVTWAILPKEVDVLSKGELYFANLFIGIGTNLIVVVIVFMIFRYYDDADANKQIEKIRNDVDKIKTDLLRNNDLLAETKTLVLGINSNYETNSNEMVLRIAAIENMLQSLRDELDKFAAAEPENEAYVPELKDILAPRSDSVKTKRPNREIYGEE